MCTKGQGGTRQQLWQLWVKLGSGGDCGGKEAFRPFSRGHFLHLQLTADAQPCQLGLPGPLTPKRRPDGFLNIKPHSPGQMAHIEDEPEPSAY